MKDEEEGLDENRHLLMFVCNRHVGRRKEGKNTDI